MNVAGPDAWYLAIVIISEIESVQQYEQSIKARFRREWGLETGPRKTNKTGMEDSEQMLGFIYFHFRYVTSFHLLFSHRIQLNPTRRVQSDALFPVLFGKMTWPSLSSRSVYCRRCRQESHRFVPKELAREILELQPERAGEGVAARGVLPMHTRMFLNVDVLSHAAARPAARCSRGRSRGRGASLC